MATRALIHVKGDDGNTLVTIYRQCDGYPEGLGQDIKDAIGRREIVNGYDSPDTQANGMGCLAAMLIAALKDGCGNVYIYSAGKIDVWEEYVYTISNDRGRVHVVCDDAAGHVLYDGLLADWEVGA